MEYKFKFMTNQNSSKIIDLLSKVKEHDDSNDINAGSYETIKQIIGIRDDASFILNDEKTDIGFLLGAYRGKEAYISNMYIFKEFRNRGYGRIMLQKGISIFHEKNCSEIRLEAIHDNIKAINLYKSEVYKTGKEILYLQNDKKPLSREKGKFILEKSDGFAFQPLFRFFHKSKRPWAKELRSLMTIIENNIGALYLLKSNAEIEGYMIISENRLFTIIHDMHFKDWSLLNTDNIFQQFFKGKTVKIESLYGDDPSLITIKKNGFYPNIKQVEMKKTL
jgi:ribosomal protein S18 acetylase RimI-like enzyme